MYTVKGKTIRAEKQDSETVTDTIVGENSFQTLQGFWKLQPRNWLSTARLNGLKSLA